VTARLFGKLPAHGDFVARGCTPVEQASLDTWLTASLADAQDRFGGEFADRFDAALPWKGRGAGAVGVIAASQDAAGRRYPLVLVCAAANDIEGLIYAAIGDRWDADRLAAAAGAGPSSSIECWTSANGPHLLAGDMPVDIVTAMLERAGV
jgi:type VI secretion system ImpM family protein